MAGIRDLMNLLFVPGHIVLAEHKVVFNFIIKYIFILNYTVVQHCLYSIRLTELFAFVFIPSYISLLCFVLILL